MNKRITGVFITLTVFFSMFIISLQNVDATQSRTQNFSKSFSTSGNGASDIVAVALAQYKKTGAELGYTEDWCADFVSDCAKLVNQENAIPADGLVVNLFNNIRNMGGTIVSVPQPGDIAFIDWNGTKGYSHVEIVYAVSGNTIHTIGGNSGPNTSTPYVSQVWKHDMSLYNGCFTCFVRPNYSSSPTPPNHEPIGWLDIAEGREGSFHVWGWAKDEDTPNTPIKVHVYIGGVVGSDSAIGYEINADQYRDDVGAHGFDAVINTPLRGNQPVYVYAIDSSGGYNPLLSGCPKTVNILSNATPTPTAKPTAKPTATPTAAPTPTPTPTAKPTAKPTATPSATSAPISDFKYQKVDGGVEITSYVGNDTQIIIPDKIEGYPVVSIGEGALENNEQIQSVVISENVKTIKDTAFVGCINLQSITFSGGLDSIGDYAFSGCQSLTKIELPEGVTTIEAYAFNNCSKLQQVHLPDSLTTIEDGAFQYCEKMESIVIPDNIHNIASGVFLNCTALKQVTLPDELYTIGTSSFGLCKNLTEITIPKAVSEIAGSAFDGCDMLSIKCWTGSAAEQYANENQIPIIIMDNTQMTVALCGDVDRSGDVTASDALIVLQEVVQLISFDDANIRKLADVNGNESIEASDALEILRMVVKLRENAYVYLEPISLQDKEKVISIFRELFSEGLSENGYGTYKLQNCSILTNNLEDVDDFNDLYSLSYTWAFAVCDLDYDGIPELLLYTGEEMRIAICDDNRFWLEQAKKMLLQYTKANGIETEVCCFQSPFELESYQGTPPDVMFMDIELQESSEVESADVVETSANETVSDSIETTLSGASAGRGITLARYINRRWRNCLIIYLTNYVYYALDVYRTAHVFFVLKTQLAERLDEIFAIIFHELEQKQKRLFFNTIGGGKLTLAPEDILYFERCGRKTMVHTTWNTFEIWEKMNEVAEMAPSLDFVRCHNSYIVYLPAVVKLEKDYFVLKNDIKVLISRAYAARTKQAFSRWAMTQIS